MLDVGQLKPECTYPNYTANFVSRHLLINRNSPYRCPMFFIRSIKVFTMYLYSFFTMRRPIRVVKSSLLLFVVLSSPLDVAAGRLHLPYSGIERPNKCIFLMLSLRLELKEVRKK